MLRFRCLLDVEAVGHTSLDVWECANIGNQWGPVGAELKGPWHLKGRLSEDCMSLVMLRDEGGNNEPSRGKGQMLEGSSPRRVLRLLRTVTGVEAQEKTANQEPHGHQGRCFLTNVRDPMPAL